MIFYFVVYRVGAFLYKVLTFQEIRGRIRCSSSLFSQKNAKTVQF